MVKVVELVEAVQVRGVASELHLEEELNRSSRLPRCSHQEPRGKENDIDS